MIKDEKDYDENEIGEQMQKLKDDLYSIMCDIHTFIRTTLNSYISEYIKRNVTDGWLNCMDGTRTWRYIKGYIISNNALKIANNLINTYN
jgi:hypothetical protein